MTAMAVQRVQELQAMFAAMQAPLVATGNTFTADPSTAVGGTQNFAAQLAQATGQTPATAAAAPVGSGLSAAAGAVPYAAEIDAAAAEHGVDPALLRALVKQESGFDADIRSPAGATGLTQLMPGTARELGVTDATDPVQALDGGARYLRQQLDRFGGDVSKALAAYNAGPGAVLKYGGIPPYAETQNYVRNILAFAEQFRGTGTAGAPGVPVVSSSPTANGSIT